MDLKTALRGGSWATSIQITHSADILTPTNVQATAGDREATVTWSPPSVGGILPLVTGYTVKTYRASDGALVGAPKTSATTSVTMTDLPNATPVYFKVIATTLFIVVSPESGQSNTVTPAGAPLAPANVSAAPGDQEVEVVWSPPDDNGSPITTYRVNVYTELSPEPETFFDAGAEATQVWVPNLRNAQRYVFTVQAQNDEGGYGPESARTLETVPAGVPFQPSSVSAVTVGPREATLVWGPPIGLLDGTPGDNGDPITVYRVQVSPPCEECSGTGVGPDDFVTTISGLEPGSPYTFQLIATNAAGEGLASAASNQIVTDADVPPSPPEGNPGAPRNVRATFAYNASNEDFDAATVSWDPPSNGAEPQNYRVTVNPGGTSILTGGQARQQLIPSLNARRTSFTFTVVAITAEGESPAGYSATVPSLKAVANAYMSGSLNAFLGAKQSEPLPFDWEDDGCTVIEPDFSFYAGCLRHDFGYRNFGHGLNLAGNSEEERDRIRHQINRILLTDMRETCPTFTPAPVIPHVGIPPGTPVPCHMVAGVVYRVVDGLGESGFNG